jgi:hypothetical protein
MITRGVTGLAMRQCYVCHDGDPAAVKECHTCWCCGRIGKWVQDEDETEGTPHHWEYKSNVGVTPEETAQAHDWKVGLR